MAAALVLALAAPVGAQAPAPACEDRLREHRAYLELVSTSRTRQEVEAARAIAEMQKRIEQLHAEVERLKQAGTSP